MIRYPVSAELRSDENDQPKPETPTHTAGIFDSHGFWAHFMTGTFECGAGTYSLAQMHSLTKDIASALNEAYEQGRVDQAEAIREGLNYGVYP